jgi:hypothetical protein
MYYEVQVHVECIPITNWASSSIGSENALNMYLNPRVHGSIPTKVKNSTREGGGEDREVEVPKAPKTRAVTHNTPFQENNNISNMSTLI